MSGSARQRVRRPIGLGAPSGGCPGSGHSGFVRSPYHGPNRRPRRPAPGCPPSLGHSEGEAARPPRWAESLACPAGPAPKRLRPLSGALPRCPHVLRVVDTDQPRSLLHRGALLRRRLFPRQALSLVGVLRGGRGPHHPGAPCLAGHAEVSRQFSPVPDFREPPP